MAVEEAERAVRTHRSTYEFFVGLMKYGAIIALVVGFIVILIISS